MNSRIYILIMSTLLASCLLFTSCSVDDSSGGIEADTEKQPDTVSISDSESTSSDIELSSAYKAYMNVLEENSDAIRAYWWQYNLDGSSDYFGVYDYGEVAEDPENKCVAFCDLNKDGIPELLFISYESNPGAFLHVYTYKNGKAEEYKYIDPPYTSNNWDTILADYSIAAGVIYMVYTGKESGSLYIATREGDAYSSYTITKYSLSDDLEISSVSSVHNRYEGYGDENGNPVVIDDYDIGGHPVSAEEGIASFRELSEDYGQLIMFAGYNKDMKVFKHVKTDQPLAMKYTDAVNYARSQI